MSLLQFVSICVTLCVCVCICVSMDAETCTGAQDSHADVSSFLFPPAPERLPLLSLIPLSIGSQLSCLYSDVTAYN